MNPKTSTVGWVRCETFELPNATAIIWHTGQCYRAQLEIDHDTTQSLKLSTPHMILSSESGSIDEAKEKAQKASVILENMKVGVNERTIY